MKCKPVHDFVDNPVTAHSDKNIVIKGEAFSDFDRVFMVRCIYVYLVVLCTRDMIEWANKLHPRGIWQHEVWFNCLDEYRRCFRLNYCIEYITLTEVLSG